MRYLVTGAAGFIGSHLCERLIGECHDVVGLDNFSTYYARRFKEGNVAEVARSPRLRLVEADLATVDWGPLLDGVDGVFHLAGQPGVRLSWGDGFAAYLEGNVWVTQRLFEAVQRTCLPVVCASSSSVYGDSRRRELTESDALSPVSPYGLTKLAIEHLARIYREDHGNALTCLRYFTVYGPRQRPDMAFARFIDAVNSGGSVLVFGTGRQTRDFTFVSDVVEATILALGAPAPIYNIGGGQPASVLDVLDHLADLVGHPLRLEFREPARGDVGHTWADTRLAHADLGWSPRIGLAEGLAAQFNHSRRWYEVAG